MTRHGGRERGRGWLWVGLTIVLACTGACGDGAAAGDEEEPPTWRVTGAPEVLIGAQDGAVDYLFESVASVRLLSDGGIAVADRGFFSVRVFSAQGEIMAGMGGEGDGPGEFVWLNHLSVLGPDTLVVFDGSAFRTTRFLTDGTLLGTRALRAPDGRVEVFLGSFENGDVAAAWIAEAGGRTNVAVPDVMRIGRFDASGDFIAALGEAHGMRRTIGGPVPFSPYMHGFLVDDSVVVTDGADSTVLVLAADGEVARTIGVSTPSVPIGEAWRILREVLESRQESASLERVPAEAEAEAIPRIAEVLLDTQDRLWVKHYDPATDSHLLGGWTGARGGAWSVVEMDGSPVAEVILPSDFIPMDERDGRIAGVVRDPLGVERVAVYRIGG